jgi:hypothetical protein
MSAGRLASAGEITPAHLSVLATILANLPVGQIVALFSAPVTVDTVMAVVEQAIGLIGTVDPLIALPAEAIGMGVQALQVILDAAGVGSSVITGGLPPSIPPGLGPTPWEGR